MCGSVVYVLLFCSTLSSLCSSQTPHHGHHSRLDVNPDMELKPVRPLRRTTQRSITVSDTFRLPEPPYQPLTDEKADLLDSDYDYSYDYEHFHHGGTNAGSGTIHGHHHDSNQLSTESTFDYAGMPEYPEYADGLDGHKDHLKNASTAVSCAWYSVVLSLFLMKMAALI